MHVRTWHVFTDGGGATATSEGAAGVGIAIVPPAAAQRQQLTLRSERLEPIAEASEQTRARTNNEAEVIAATRALRMIAAQALIGDQVKLHSDSKLTLQVVLGTRSMRVPPASGMGAI